MTTNEKYKDALVCLHDISLICETRCGTRIKDRILERIKLLLKKHYLKAKKTTKVRR